MSRGSHETPNAKELGNERGLRARLARFFVNRKGSTMTGPLSVGDYIRSTGISAPADGAGVEIAYYAGSIGTILAYDRGTSTWKQLNIDGSPLKLNSNSAGVVLIGGAANYIQITAAGDQSFEGTAGFYPRVLNQAAPPAAGTGATQCDTGEFIIWEDSDNTETWLVYNRGGTVKGIKVENI